MAIQKTEAFILRRIPLRETSWILTCLTRSFGKVKGVVKGARKEKSSWFAACELFTHVDMVYFEKTKTNLHLITELSILNSHVKLRSHFSAIAYAGYFSELMDQLLEENETPPAVFELLKSTFSLLEKNTGSFDILARAFEIKLLRILGLLPHFLNCVECGSEMGRRVYFSARQGGIFCEECHAKNHGGFLISHGCIQAIQFLIKTDIPKITQLRLGKQIKTELEQMSKRFIEFRIESQLKSLHFLSQVMPIISNN